LADLLRFARNLVANLAFLGEFVLEEKRKIIFCCDLFFFFLLRSARNLVSEFSFALASLF